LYERANWWPKGARKGASKPTVQAATTDPPPRQQPAQRLEAYDTPAGAVPSPADTHRDLAAIAEINRLMYRQSTPRDVLLTTASGVGKHLMATRCLIAVGAAGDGMQLTSEYSSPGVPTVGAGKISSVVGLISQVTPDSLGGFELHASSIASLRDVGLESALGVMLTDKETQAQSGALLIGDAKARRWKPNESFFLQAVGDQLVLSVNHTRLRSLVRSLAVADEKTGLLSRGAYIDCLLVESNRARAQSTPISLIVLHVDHGGEILRQHGDASVDRYIEQLARALSSSVRQTDIAVKYTAWSLVFILPDTGIDNALVLADKLRQTAATVQPPWGAQDFTISAVVAEASARAGDETEDRVTEWINRAESGLDEARQRGGDTLVALLTP